ncbi:MAG: hypothetical protein ACR2HW_08065 [Gemmatimonadales bacterium]
MRPAGWKLRIRLEESGLRARFARDSLLPSARTRRSRALKAYQSGETGVLPVLDALRSERDAPFPYISAVSINVRPSSIPTLRAASSSFRRLASCHLPGALAQDGDPLT